MQKKWFSILLFAPLMQSNYALADQAKEKELNYQGLGEVLFFDKSLSFNKTQSCSTCHNPGTTFVDQRKNSAKKLMRKRARKWMIKLPLSTTANLRLPTFPKKPTIM